MFPKRGRPPLYTSETERRAAVKKLSKKRNTTRVYLLEAFDQWSKTKDLSPFKKATNAVFANHIIEIHNTYCTHCNLDYPPKSDSSVKLQLSEFSEVENTSSSLSNGDLEIESTFTNIMDPGEDKVVHNKSHHLHNTEMKADSTPSTSRRNTFKKQKLMPSTSQAKKSFFDLQDSETNESQDDSIGNNSETSTTQLEQEGKGHDDDSSDDQLLSDSSLPPKKKKKWLQSRTLLTCAQCGHVSASKKALNTHMQRLHPEHLNSGLLEKSSAMSDPDVFKKYNHGNRSGKIYKDCSPNLYPKTNIEKHSFTTISEEQTYHCTNCNNTFQHVVRLDCDKKSPNREYPIQCSHCHFTYHQLKELKGTGSNANISTLTITPTDSKSKQSTAEPNPLPEINMHEVFEKSLTYYLDHNGT